MHRAAAVLLALATAMTFAVTGVADEPEYQLQVSGPASLDAGVDGSIDLTIAPSAGQRISQKGPVRIAVAVEPSTGLSPKRARLDRKHANDPKAATLRFAIGLTPKAGGKYQVALDIRFWICGNKTCRPVRERRQVEIEVNQPDPPVADGGP